MPRHVSDLVLGLLGKGALTAVEVELIRRELPEFMKDSCPQRDASGNLCMLPDEVVVRFYPPVIERKTTRAAGGGYQVETTASFPRPADATDEMKRCASCGAESRRAAAEADKLCTVCAYS